MFCCLSDKCKNKSKRLGAPPGSWKAWKTWCEGSSRDVTDVSHTNPTAVDGEGSEDSDDLTEASDEADVRDEEIAEMAVNPDGSKGAMADEEMIVDDEGSETSTQLS